ncbi:MAG: ABC transporter permease [bacterium]|nr:MAG: ABC transporter permease [bacterium]
MNTYINLIKTAIDDFKRNKIRTFLTSLGITVGVMSVVLLIALGLGLKNYIEEQFESLGANLLIVFPGSVFSEDSGAGGNFGAGFAGGANFDEKDLKSLQKVSDVKYVIPLFTKSLALSSTKTKKLGYVIGTSDDAFEALNIELVEGRQFGSGDVLGKSKKAVIGFTMAEKLFGDPELALGQTVKANDVRFNVVGLAKKKGDQQLDDGLFVPYTATYGSLNPSKTFFNIYIATTTEEKIPTVKEASKQVLLKRYNEDDFSVTEQSQILSSVNQIFGIINTILVAIGSISLFVGGIGIMNIMYATVTERTKEIGIRRAIGATEKDILSQFLTESVVLSLMGGIVGLIFSAIIVWGIRFFFPASLNLVAVLVALFVSSGIGILFGVFPARRAAKLSPIDAIRYE